MHELLPTDPFGDDETIHCEDACTAVGVAVLQALADGAQEVTVTRNGTGGYSVEAYNEEDEE